MSSFLIKNAKIITGFATLPDSCIYIEDNIISDIFSSRRLGTKEITPGTVEIDAAGMIATPGLIDSHIHGIGGYGTEDMCADSILGMSECLVQYGVTSFLPTLYPDGEQYLYESEEAVCKAIGNERGARILGINVEGPFISPKRPGALPISSLSPVDIDYFDRIVEHGQGHVVCMTVAPELKHMHELALHAKAKEIVLLAGHTDATYENMIEGMQCGILHSTHFFNAMSRLHHRNPGAVGAIMINPDMCCEIIADGVHVHPELVKLVLRLKPSENIVLITDGLKPTGVKNGKLYANGAEVVLSDEGAFVSAADQTLLNGSALTLNKAIYNLKEWGIDPSQTVQMASENPARIYNLKNLGVLVPGNLADIAVFNDKFEAQAVFVGGRLVKNNL